MVTFDIGNIDWQEEPPSRGQRRRGSRAESEADREEQRPRVVGNAAKKKYDPMAVDADPDGLH